VTDTAVPFMDLRPKDDGPEIERAMRRVVERGWFVLGPEVEAFEREFATASGAQAAVGVGTGTDAIFLILKALGLGPGDEVITTPLSAAYTALAVLMTGARPVFADLDPDRLTISPDAIAAAIGPRTVAILPVHLYGQAADMTAIAQIAARHHLAIIEDCCQAHLGTSQGRPVGTIGVAGAFSFYPTKNLGALGDGGAIVTNDTALAERLKRLRNGGQRDRYHHLEAGVNTRLDELQAAVLRVRLRRLPAWTESRRALARRYRTALADAPVVVPPEADAGHVYHLFTVRSLERARLQQHLMLQGIDTLIHYPVPIGRQPALADASPTPCPVADLVCGDIVSLPLYPSLSPDAVDRVARAIHDFVPSKVAVGLGPSIGSGTTVS
jgi:dTDP-3-amino-3,4,6-trideoxy-alpha-D-glucose transaminase